MKSIQIVNIGINRTFVGKALNFMEIKLQEAEYEEIMNEAVAASMVKAMADYLRDNNTRSNATNNAKECAKMAIRILCCEESKNKIIKQINTLPEYIEDYDAFKIQMP